MFSLPRLMFKFKFKKNCSCHPFVLGCSGSTLYIVNINKISDILPIQIYLYRNVFSAVLNIFCYEFFIISLMF